MIKNTKKNEMNYTNESITALKGADRVRLRPAVIFGSDGILGCKHSIFEILSNSIDEAREGHGNIIKVEYLNDKSITIEDNGRGIPVDYNKNEEKYNWELLFCELYAGGKYLNNTGENYEFSLGLNGLGLCSTQYSSKYMDVEIKRDGYKYNLHFEKGKNIGGLTKVKSTVKNTGTKIKWLPDTQVFTDIDVEIDYFKEMLKRQCIVNRGLKFEFYDERENKTYNFCYENGIKDYIKELAGNKSIINPVYYIYETKGKDREDKEEYKLKFEIIFTFKAEGSVIEYYHNSSYLEYGGAPDKAVKLAFVYVIDKHIKENNFYKKDEKKIIYSDIEDSLILIINSFSTSTSYENQTKKAITNKFIQDAITDYLKINLDIYFIENKLEGQKILNQVIVNKRSRETAEKTRINIRKKLTGNIDMNNRVDKFVNCRSKDTTKREIYIVEGDSALGACMQGRDSNFQGIMPVRGKILNCLKANYEKIFASDIITDLLKVLGCGVELKTKHNKELNNFDITKLKWDKIIICTDADVDGFQIRTLILTMLYTLTPTLIEEKKVFIAESPLYEVNCGKNTYFAYSEKEKNEIIQKLKLKYTVQRSKGLGENEPEMMWQTTMNPETRKLIQVLPEDNKKTKEIFEILLGDNLEGRKDYIEKNGHKYIDLTDV